MIDLHTHSTYSDGSDQPAQLARRAREVGLSAIALTDHDSTLGHQEMALACAAEGVDYVVGVEVSLRDNEFPKVRAGTPPAPPLQNAQLHALAPQGNPSATRFFGNFLIPVQLWPWW